MPLLYFCRQNDLMQIRFTLRCIQYMMTSALRSEWFTFDGKKW